MFNVQFYEEFVLKYYDYMFAIKGYYNISYNFYSILNGKSVMKLAIYIDKSGVKDFNERMACEDLKDAFEELDSIPVFIENMSVHINCEGKYYVF